MTVKQLIEALQKAPPDLVVVAYDEYDWRPIGSVEVLQMRQEKSIVPVDVVSLYYDCSLADYSEWQHKTER